MQSKTIKPSVYGATLQRNAYSCSCLWTKCKQTCTLCCKMDLKLIEGECEQFCDPKTCTLNFMGGQYQKQHRNAIYCTRTSETDTSGYKCVRCSPSDSYRSNFISSAPSTACQGLATQFSTVQRKDNSNTWCE